MTGTTPTGVPQESTAAAPIETTAPAPETTESGTPPVGQPPGRANFAEITANRRKQFEKDSGVKIERMDGQAVDVAPPTEEEGPPVEEPPAETPPVEEPPVAEAAPVDGAPPAPAPAETPPEMVKIKVNGEDRWITKSDYERFAQKGVAADETFREAARLNREAKELLRQPQAAPVTEPAAPAAAKGPDAASTDLEIDDATVQALQYGTADEVKSALKKVVSAARAKDAPQGPTLDAQQVVQMAVAEAKWRTDYDRDIETVGKEFPEIFADKFETKIAADEVHDIRVEEIIKLGYPADKVRASTPQQIVAAYRKLESEGRVKPNVDVFRDAGKRVRDWRTGKIAAAAQNTPPSAPPQTRIERKQAAPQTPRPSSARAPGPPATPPRKTGSELVAAQRKARGQAVA